MCLLENNGIINIIKIDIRKGNRDISNQLNYIQSIITLVS